MNIATQTAKLIKKENPTINTEWLECISEDFDNGELSHEQCYQSIQGFIRGLLATGAVDIFVLDDLDKLHQSGA